MSPSPSLSELFALHVLGALDGVEAADVAARYAARAPDDRSAIDEAHAILHALAATAPPVEPPSHVRERLLARVAHDAAEVRSRKGAAGAAHPRPPSERAGATEPGPRRVRWIVPAILGGAFLLLAVMNVLQSTKETITDARARVGALLLDPATPRWILASTKDPAKAPMAVVVGDSANGRLYVSAPNMPSPGPGRSYVVWTIGKEPGAAPRNVGSIAVSSAAGVLLELSATRSLSELAAVALSVETDPAVTSPTADQIVAMGAAPGG